VKKSTRKSVEKPTKVKKPSQPPTEKKIKRVSGKYQNYQVSNYLSVCREYEYSKEGVNYSSKLHPRGK